MRAFIIYTLNKVSLPIIREFTFSVFMYVLGCLCILVSEENNYLANYLKLFAELFLDVYLLCVFICILPSKVRILAKAITASFLYTIAIIDVFCFVRVGSSISPTLTQLVYETNQAETVEFLSTYIDKTIFLTPVSLILLLACCHILFHFFAKRVFLKLRQRRVQKSTPQMLSAAIFLMVIGSIICSYKNKHYVIKSFQFDTISKIENYFGSEFWAKKAFYLPIYRLALALHSNHLASQQTNELLTVANDIHIDQCLFTSPNIILIIGESYNKHHSQLYGYKKATTPHQAQRVDDGEMAVFTDVVTPFNITSDSFKNFLSLNDLSNNESWSEKPLFTQVFKKAGYHVSFLTNQFNKKEQTGFAQFSGSVFLNQPEMSISQFNSRNMQSHQYDEGLLEDYNSLKGQYSQRGKLVIFHLIGQHVDYKDRYPVATRFFMASDYQRSDLNENERRIIADYDNATRYNDQVVNSIIHLFENDDAVVVYFADHGEECFDDMKQFGRNHGAITREIAKNEFEIPFWIWMSETYRKQHPEISRQIFEARERKAIIDDLPHLMLSLAGISCDDYQSRLNILSPDYDINRKRLLRNTDDYDTIVR